MSDSILADRCDEDVYRNGVCVAILNGPRSHTIEDWIQDVAALSGQKTDWSMAAGWAVVKTVGDPARVRGVMEELWPALVAAYLECDDNFTRNPEAQDVIVRWYVDENGKDPNSLPSAAMKERG